MKRVIGLGVVALVTLALLYTSIANAAWPMLDLGTPTVGVYLPLVMRQSTPTFTPTPTTTPTPTATPTATATATLPPAQPMTGNLWRDDPSKPSYATNIENVWHWFWIQNNNANPVHYGILGVNVVNQNTGYNFFHTSWSGQNALNGALMILGNGCYGPGTYPCSPNPDGAQQEDTVIVAQPGHYEMTLAICQSSYLGCLQPGAAWSNLSTVQFDAIDWTPQPGITAPTPPPPSEPCRLITDDPRGVYLKCVKP